MTALAVLSFVRVSKELREQSQTRLHQASKAAGMAILERLLFLEYELRIVASNLSSGPGAAIDQSSERPDSDLGQRFKGVELVTDGGGSRSLIGRIENPPDLTAAEKQHFSTGKPLLTIRHRPGLASRIFMGSGLDPRGREMLLGEIDTEYLWGVGEQNTLPSSMELCVLDQSSTVLFSSLPLPLSFPDGMTSKMTRSASGQFEWTHQGKQYLSRYWSVFLQGKFGSPGWTVVLSESKAEVLAPMANFRMAFSLIVLLSLWIVLLLSISQIRRSMVPLEKLQAGTRRIAEKDFDSRVTIRSGDEFEELGKSFNSMASQLGRQFHALGTMNEIDRSILSALDTTKIVDTVLARMRDVIPCDCVSVTLLKAGRPDLAQTYVGNGSPGTEAPVETVRLTPDEAQKLRDNPESLSIAGDDVPHYLEPLTKRGIKSFLLLPIFVQQSLAGFITLGHILPAVYTQEDLVQAHQLADQVAVALSTQLTGQLRHPQKMEAVGRLAGGVAHDFNNLLTIIMGYTELVLAGSDPKSRTFQNLNEIRMAATRTVSLTRQLLTFSRKEVVQPTVLELNTVVTEVSKMLKRLIGEDIDLETVLAPDTGRVKADPGHLEQIIINLAVNARDAMPQGGSITIETAKVELDEGYLGPNLKPGPYVMLSVIDNGCGMDEEVQAHIFEPFFTTKEEGKGTGLGLFTVYGIVQQNNGHISVHSEPGQGTTFKICLPRIEPEEVLLTDENLPAAVNTGTETILLLEDVDQLRRWAIVVLQGMGYKVLGAADGLEALRVSEDYEGPIHLLVTDVVTPGMSGRSVAERLVTLRPEMKVLFMSGYTDDAIARHGVLGAGSVFLQKPFTGSALAQKVREILDVVTNAPSKGTN
jgi:signal transduction histidine kinase/ActR/RegA family two-component response regulator